MAKGKIKELVESCERCRHCNKCESMACVNEKGQARIRYRCTGEQEWTTNLFSTDGKCKEKEFASIHYCMEWDATEETRAENAPHAIRFAEDMQDSYRRWAYLYKEGGSDPTWSDGVNMNLVRGHIIHARKQCERYLREEDFPEEYYKALPPEMSADYMANPERIREEANETLKAFEANEDVQYIRDNIGKVEEKARSKGCLRTILGYVENLRTALAEDDLIALRRNRKDCLGNYMKSFSRGSHFIREYFAGHVTVTDDAFDEEDLCECGADSSSTMKYEAPTITPKEEWDEIEKHLGTQMSLFEMLGAVSA